METRAHHILIGLFTVLIVAAAIGFALWLGKVDGGKRYEQYDIVFEEAVSGLSKGSAVQFSGIKIGEVSNLRLDPVDPRRVVARIRVDSNAPVHADTSARLVMMGVTGISIIRLSSGNDMKSPRLHNRDGKVPVIVANPSPISKLLADGEDVISNVNELLLQTRTLFSTENTASISRSLRNLEQISSAIAAEREDMRQAIRQLAQASQQANTALLAATRMMSNANSLISEQGKQTLESAQRSMAAFEKAMQTVDKLVADNRDQLDGGMRSFADLGPAITELRVTLASLHKITRRLEDKPADFLLGNEPTREFQP